MNTAKNTKQISMYLKSKMQLKQNLFFKELKLPLLNP